MTNKDKYKQAFSVLHTSDDFSLEVKTVKHTNKNRIFRKLASAAAAIVIVLASANTAYAMNLGGSSGSSSFGSTVTRPR